RVHGRPVAGLDDVQQVEVRVLELDDKRLRVGCERLRDGFPKASQRRPALRVRDRVVDLLDRLRGQRPARVEADAFADVERGGQAVRRELPARGQVGHDTTLWIL